MNINNEFDALPMVLDINDIQNILGDQPPWGTKAFFFNGLSCT